MPRFSQGTITMLGMHLTQRTIIYSEMWFSVPFENKSYSTKPWSFLCVNLFGWVSEQISWRRYWGRESIKWDFYVYIMWAKLCILVGWVAGAQSGPQNTLSIPPPMLGLLAITLQEDSQLRSGSGHHHCNREQGGWDSTVACRLHPQWCRHRAWDQGQSQGAAARWLYISCDCHWGKEIHSNKGLAHSKMVQCKKWIWFHQLEWHKGRCTCTPDCQGRVSPGSTCSV